MLYLDIFGKDYKTVQFDGISDIASFILKCKDKKKWRILEGEGWDFNNNCTFEEAFKQMVYGYKCDAKAVENISEFFDMDYYGGSSPVMDVEGSSYDIGSVIQDIPECCIADSSLESKKHIRFVVSVGFNSSIESKYILNRGLAITGLALNLMFRGYAIDLDFLMEYNTYTKKTSVFFLRMPVGTFDYSLIAFLNSPQFLRRICIGVSDFILDEDINGNATGVKSYQVLKWCKENSLYFEDGYDVNNNKLIKEMYETPQKAIESIRKQYKKWVESKNF